MPTSAPQAKVDARTRGYGSEVIYTVIHLMMPKAKCEEIKTETGETYLHPMMM